jgi:hypothetical protein
MPEIGTSGSMSGDGKRSVGHRPQATAPILDSTVCMVRPCVARGFRRSVGSSVLHQCIRPLIGACAPGHHGYQRACVLISCQASTGPNGSPVFACAGKTGPPSRLILSQTSAGNRIRCYVIAAPWVQFLCSCHEAVPPSRPAIDLRRRAQGPSSLAVALTSPPAQRFQARLDGTEHGATLKQVGAPSRLSCCIRSCAPC